MRSQTFLFFTIMASAFYGTLAESSDAASTVCLLQDPANQCGKFCLTALKPIMDHISLHQQQWDTRDAVIVNETEAKLNRIEARLESMNSQQTALDNKLLALQKTLSKIEKKMVLQNFNQFGSKHFYVEQNLKRNWTAAIRSCSEMGGHLATIEDGSEFNAIVEKLKEDVSYRIDINDLAEKGRFVSHTSGKPAAFLKWKPGEPNYTHETQRCVTINDGGMWVDGCNSDMLFICQANEEE